MGIEIKTAGVVLDTWKMPIFKKHLDGASRTYTEHPGPYGTSILKIEYGLQEDLRPILEAAQNECATFKQSKGKT